MTLIQVAHRAAIDAGDAIGATLSPQQREKVTAIIASAMEQAVIEVSSQHANMCGDGMIHDQDLAHKIQQKIERQKIGLVANLSSLR